MAIALCCLYGNQSWDAAADKVADLRNPSLTRGSVDVSTFPYVKDLVNNHWGEGLVPHALTVDPRAHSQWELLYPENGATFLPYFWLIEIEGTYL